MNPGELRAILFRLVNTLAQVMDSGEELSDEFMGEIAQGLQVLMAQIQQAGQIEAVPTTSNLRMDRPMPSSNVHSFSYDPKNQRLFVRFQDKWPNQNGPVYSYEGVPLNIFDIFRRGAIPAKTDGENKWGKWWKGKYPSLGAAMYHLIRAGGFPYQRLT